MKVDWNVSVELFNVVRLDVIIEIVVLGVEWEAAVAELEYHAADRPDVGFFVAPATLE